MTISHLLEDFGGGAEAKDDTLRFLTDDELEDVRLAAFEQGYSAGWEDATVAQARDHKRISAELASRLEDLSFTYHEAAGSMMKAVEPVFTTIVDQILPDTMKALLAHQILAQLEALAREATDIPAVLSVPVGVGPAVTDLIPPDLRMPVRVVELAELGDGQAELKFGAEEREIDYAALNTTIGEAIGAFFHQLNKEASNG